MSVSGRVLKSLGGVSFAWGDLGISTIKFYGTAIPLCKTHDMVMENVWVDAFAVGHVDVPLSCYRQCRVNYFYSQRWRVSCFCQIGRIYVPSPKRQGSHGWLVQGQKDKLGGPSRQQHPKIGRTGTPKWVVCAACVMISYNFSHQHFDCTPNTKPVEGQVLQSHFIGMIIIQGGPLLVINGVITTINGLINW